MNSPRAIAAQNTCAISGTIRSENCAMTRLSITRLPGRDIAGPGPGPDSAPIAATPRPRARLATTGALLNHRARMTYKVPPSGRVLRSPREPKVGLRTPAPPAAKLQRGPLGPCGCRSPSARLLAGADPAGSSSVPRRLVRPAQPGWDFAGRVYERDGSAKSFDGTRAGHGGFLFLAARAIEGMAIVGDLELPVRPSNCPEMTIADL
jgi:hypothetical protein